MTNGQDVETVSGGSDASTARSLRSRSAKVRLVLRRFWRHTYRLCILDHKRFAAKSWGLVPIVCAVIIMQHFSYHSGRYSFVNPPPNIDHSTSIRNPSIYTYGMYYWGLLPVYSTYVLGQEGNPKLYSREQAIEIALEKGETLRMDDMNAIGMGHSALRWGAHINKLLEYPIAVLTGAPRDVAHRLTLSYFYVAALILLTISLWRYAPFPLFVILPILLSSSEFVVQDLYMKGKVIHVLLTATVFSCALLCPFIFDRRIGAAAAVRRLVLLGILLAVFVNMRATVAAAVLGSVFVLLCYKRAGWRRRAAYAALLLGSLLVCSKTFDAWWNHKYQQAQEIVENLGGVPFNGVVDMHHQIWHPIWCGFADFDTKHGYIWKDSQAERYALPFLKEAGFDARRFSRDHGYTAPMRIANAPGYGAIIKRAVIKQVMDDPLWYLNILKQRIIKIATKNSPPTCYLFVRTLSFPLPWLLLLVTPLLCLVLRLDPLLKLIFISLPTASVPLLVTTYGNQQFMVAVHIFTLAILVSTGARLTWFGSKGLLGRLRLAHARRFLTRTV